MNFDYSKRDYLLPNGCKDLIDVINLEKQQKMYLLPWKLPPLLFPKHSSSLPNTAKPLTLQETLLPPPPGDILVSEKTSVRELAALVKQKPFKVIADLMELGVFAQVNQELDFATVSKVLRKYGYSAKRQA
jgi:hypothetical protein